MSRSNVTATEALRRLVAEVKLLDADEVGERWNQLGGVLAVADGVLRDGEPSAPTDISARLREYANDPGYSHNDYADTMRIAADECERFYGGMVAWKEAAQAKDASWNRHVEEIVAKHVAAQVAAQPVGAVPAANQIELAQYFRAAFDTPIARRKWDGGEAGEFCRKHFRDLLDAAPVAGSAAPSGEVERDKLALAYGILWHVNAGMEAPAECNVLSVTPERAAYEARKALRDMLTKEQRGHGIHAARESLAAIAATKE